MNVYIAIIIFCLGSALANVASIKSLPDHEALSQEMVDYINLKAKTTWEARHNSKGVPVSHVKMLRGALKQNLNGPTFETIEHEVNLDAIPKEFDSRKEWPQCPSIREIQDQGVCGAGWAIGTTTVISDRICIATRGKVNVNISSYEVLGCEGRIIGCNAGVTKRAWSYYKDHGVVTGGPFDSNQGCQPYLFPPCEHQVPGPRPPCISGIFDIPVCVEKCVPSYNGTYKSDKHYGRSVYKINGVEQMQTEIMKNGPITGNFMMYSDFLSYKSGVYQHKTGSWLYLHSVRILGWGVENGTPYWLAANSWNSDWGDKGFFKILRGSNECGIEDQVIAGLPKLDGE
ncbi:Cathepsin B [Lamellibrachia satsuma]|nr:Cathepsin B [Lamellibrachia satsuma]